MGEHASWSDFLYYLPGYNGLNQAMKHELGRTPGDTYHWEGLMFGASHWTLTHVIWAMLVVLIVLAGGLSFSSSVRKKGGIVPPTNFGLRNFFEMFVDSVFGLMEQVMGPKNARRFLPLIGSLAIFIFFSNIMALIPGFGVPTATLKTNLGIALLVFFATHYYGIKESGLSYFKHFFGPLPILAPLMFPIELISHFARPASLALRLMGNMAADHKVVFTFFALIPLLVPVPFLLLGLLVSIVQTLVFCLLSMVYIDMAIAHDH